MREREKVVSSNFGNQIENPTTVYPLVRYEQGPYSILDSKLSKLHWKIFELSAEGQNTLEIAGTLGYQVKTVEIYAHQGKKLLGRNSFGEVILQGIENDDISVPVDQSLTDKIGSLTPKEKVLLKRLVNADNTHSYLQIANDLKDTIFDIDHTVDIDEENPANTRNVVIAKYASALKQDAKEDKEVETINTDDCNNWEQDVLVQIAKGAKTKEIAENLNYAPSSVQSKTNKLLRKYGVSSKLQLVIKAIKQGDVEVEVSVYAIEGFYLLNRQERNLLNTFLRNDGENSTLEEAAIILGIAPNTARIYQQNIRQLTGIGNLFGIAAQYTMAQKNGTFRKPFVLSKQLKRASRLDWS